MFGRQIYMKIEVLGNKIGGGPGSKFVNNSVFKYSNSFRVVKRNWRC